MRPLTAPLPDVTFGRRDVVKLLAGVGGALLTGCAIGPTPHSRASAETPDWARLQNKVRGRVITRGSVEYESRRHAMLWNAVKPARFPDAIVQVESDADVAEAVRFARQHALRVAVRGGGHNWHNPALRQGGVLLDLARLNQVQVNADRRSAIVQPVVTGAAFMANLAPHGLAFPIGHCPAVPLSGFLLNGGLGWNFRNWGPSCASIQALDIVDGRGELLRVDKDRHPDLFWAARGAGPGFFGVVTRFHLSLFALPAMLRSTLSYRVEDMESVAEWLSGLVPLPAPVELSCTFSNRGAQLSAVAFAETELQARQALEILEAVPAGLNAVRKNLYQEASVESVFGRASATVSESPRYAGDSGWSDASPSDLLTSVRSGLVSAAPGSVVQLVFKHSHHLLAEPDMAFSLSGSTYVHTHALWDDAHDDALNTAWVRSTITSLEPLKLGHYVGEADLAFAPNRAQQCFAPAAWTRLIALKRKYDPGDLFYSYLR